MGRKRTPTALKKLRGNPGKRPLPENEPVPALSSLDPPDYLTEDARVEWYRICDEVVEVGIVTVLDEPLLAAWCETAVALRIATQRAVKKGTQRQQNGAMVSSAFVRQRDALSKELRALASELGFSPTARSKVTAAPGAKRRATGGWDDIN